MTAYEPLLEDSVDIAAPPTAVWPLVSDLTRMPEWSPQVRSTRLRSGLDEVGLGAQFTNKNAQVELVWVTHAEVVRYDAEKEIAFRIEENYVVWAFSLEPTADGTRLTQRRETPDGISELSFELTDGFLGGQEQFTEALRAGMRQTLERIKAAAEGWGLGDG